jgi:hypothetical protein
VAVPTLYGVDQLSPHPDPDRLARRVLPARVPGPHQMTSPSTRFSWARISVDDQRRCLELIGNDGHTVYDPIRLVDKGFPPAVVAHFSRRIDSNIEDPKETIFDTQGQALAYVYGVYGLEILYDLARHYGITSSALGRGFAARELTEQLREHLLHL